MANRSEYELVALIYEAAFDDELWPIVMADIADCVGARHAFLGVHDTQTGTHSVAPRTDPDHLRLYNEAFVDKNPCVPAMMAAPVGRLFHTPGEVTDGEEYRRSEIFNEWCRPGDMGYGAMCMALTKSARRQAFTSVYKPWGVDYFEPHERTLYGALGWHVGRALQLQRRVFDLRSQVNCAAGAIETLDDGIIVVDSEARILFMGGACHEIMQRSQLTAEDGMTLSLAPFDAQLRQMIASCLGRGSSLLAGRTISIPREGRSDLRVTVMPYPANRRSERWLEAAGSPAATLVLSDSDLRVERACGRLRDRYGLTAAETRLAMEIAKGDGKRAAADRCGISYATARAQLSSIFEKTGVHRQAELVRLLAGA